MKTDFLYEDVEEAYNKWSKEGRTEEQKYAVINFLTGAGRRIGIQRLQECFNCNEMDITFWCVSCVNKMLLKKKA